MLLEDEGMTLIASLTKSFCPFLEEAEAIKNSAFKQ